MFRQLSRKFSQLGRSRSGNFATMFALTLPIGIACAAFAVDEGSLYVERRQAQSITDLAAIYAAANIAKADAAVLKVFSNNLQDATLVGDMSSQGMAAGFRQVQVEKGRYARDPSVAAGKRFVLGATPFNAVRVTFRKDGTTYFANALLGQRTIVTEAVASAPAEAAFSIGSRLASLNDGLLNSLLGSLLDTSISLSLMDYNALLATDVSALQFMNALATELKLTAGTYADVLKSEATVGQIVSALATTTKDKAADVALAKLLGANIPGSLKVPLAHFIDLGQLSKLSTGYSTAGLDANVGIMELLGAAAAIANGKNQVALDLGGGVPGLLQVKLDVAIGEPPQGYTWFGIGETGKIVRTAQTRLRLEATVGGAGGLLNGVLGTTVKLPIYVELAYGEGQLKSVSCPTGKPASAVVTVAAKPGVAEVWLGEINPADLKLFDKKPKVNPAQLINVNAVNLIKVEVTGSANVDIGNMVPKNLTFTKNDIDNRVIKNVSSQNLTQSLTSSLIGNLTLNAKVSVLGLGIGLFVPSEAAVKTAVTGLLSGVTAPVDKLLFNALSLLGVKVGEADIRVHGVSCGRSVLVL
ncbi:TadG family pilus assembly protein [Aminobacter sp. HY435]|uniref:TadG family pilus assembly protein n=1 Tax=Aminobacter sp. HY435 TaxID=2970917 RepID=UPI0022B96433|nr:pilus assembly protein TadG-related protein [Aminobacter sp. HY435]